MNGAESRLGATSSGFALAAGITVLFNTALACAKDAYKPLSVLMNSIASHNWITQGIADGLLFALLGLIFSRLPAANQMSATRVTNFLVIAVVVAGLGLFGWYAFF